MCSVKLFTSTCQYLYADTSVMSVIFCSSKITEEMKLVFVKASKRRIWLEKYENQFSSSVNITPSWSNNCRTYHCPKHMTFFNRNLLGESANNMNHLIVTFFSPSSIHVGSVESWHNVRNTVGQVVPILINLWERGTKICHVIV